MQFFNQDQWIQYRNLWSFSSLLLYPAVYLFFISAFYMVFIGCAGKYIIMLATSNLILRMRMFSLDFQSYPAHDPVKMEVL